MTNVFITILNISITATYIALAVILARLLLKRSPKWISCLLWAIVAIRLLVPFSVESRLSLVPKSINNIKIESVAKTEPQKEISVDTISPTQSPETDSSTIIHNNTQNPQSNAEIPATPTTPAAPVTPVFPSTDTNADESKEQGKTPVTPATTNTEDDTSAREKVFTILSYVWIGGTSVMLVYCGLSFLHLRSKVQISLETEKGIFICDNIDTPFILGIIRPKIYLPSTLGDEDKAHIIAHEKAHLKRCDNLWKPLGFVLLSLHWFNPIMWLAYTLLCRDIEFACDEKVLIVLGNEHKKDYSKTLFECSIERKVIAACPLAFGEVGVKQRIKNVLNYKRPAFWVTVTALILCVAISFCFLTNPVSKSNDEDKNHTSPTTDNTTDETQSIEDIYPDLYYFSEKDNLASIIYDIDNDTEDELVVLGIGLPFSGLYNLRIAAIELEDGKITDETYKQKAVYFNHINGAPYYSNYTFYTSDDGKLILKGFTNSSGESELFDITFINYEGTALKESGIIYLSKNDLALGTDPQFARFDIDNDNVKEDCVISIRVSTQSYKPYIIAFENGDLDFEGFITSDDSDWNDYCNSEDINNTATIHFIKSGTSIQLSVRPTTENGNSSKFILYYDLTYKDSKITAILNKIYVDNRSFDIDNDGTTESCTLTTAASSSESKVSLYLTCRTFNGDIKYENELEIKDFDFGSTLPYVSLENTNKELYLYILRNSETIYMYELGVKDGKIIATLKPNLLAVGESDIDQDAVNEDLYIEKINTSTGFVFSLRVEEYHSQEYYNTFSFVPCMLGFKRADEKFNITCTTPDVNTETQMYAVSVVGDRITLSKGGEKIPYYEGKDALENISAFSFQSDLEYYNIDLNKTYSGAGIKTKDFKNSAEDSEITTFEQAISRAKNELTISYNKTSAKYDKSEKVWRVSFWTHDTLGGDQTVYLNSNGKTLLCIYGE